MSYWLRGALLVSPSVCNEGHRWGSIGFKRYHSRASAKRVIIALLAKNTAFTFAVFSISSSAILNNSPSLSDRARVLPTVIKLLIISNALLFMAQMAGWDEVLTAHLALWPAGTPEVIRYGQSLFAVPQFEIWQLLTYGFLHGGISHLFFNLLALWMFGAQIENAWGLRRFATYYFVCVIGAGLVQLLVVTFFVDNIAPTIGASGGVFGLLLAYGMMFPNRVIVLLIPPIPIKAKWFVIFYGGLTLFFGITGTASGIAHFAHLGGMLFGFLLLVYWSFRKQT